MAGLTEGRTSDTGIALLGLAFRGIRALRARGTDTGVVFCARADFEAIGGYREDAARRYWYGPR
jgi:hypothetical protein